MIENKFLRRLLAWCPKESLRRVSRFQSVRQSHIRVKISYWKISFYMFSLGSLTGLLGGVNCWFLLYYRSILGMRSGDWGKSVLGITAFLINPVLIFIFFFFFQGKKIDLKTEIKPIFISLFLGGFIGRYIGRLMGTTLMFNLLHFEDMITSMVLIQFPNVLLGTLTLLFSSFSGMALGYFRRQEAMPSFAQISTRYSDSQTEVTLGDKKNYRKAKG